MNTKTFLVTRNPSYSPVCCFFNNSFIAVASEAVISTLTVHQNEELKKKKYRARERQTLDTWI